MVYICLVKGVLSVKVYGGDNLELVHTSAIYIHACAICM